MLDFTGFNLEATLSQSKGLNEFKLNQGLGLDQKDAAKTTDSFYTLVVDGGAESEVQGVNLEMQKFTTEEFIEDIFEQMAQNPTNIQVDLQSKTEEQVSLLKIGLEIVGDIVDVQIEQLDEEIAKSDLSNPDEVISQSDKLDTLNLVKFQLNKYLREIRVHANNLDPKVENEIKTQIVKNIKQNVDLKSLINNIKDLKATELQKKESDLIQETISEIESFEDKLSNIKLLLHTKLNEVSDNSEASLSEDQLNESSSEIKEQNSAKKETTALPDLKPISRAINSSEAELKSPSAINASTKSDESQPNLKLQQVLEKLSSLALSLSPQNQAEKANNAANLAESSGDAQASLKEINSADAVKKSPLELNATKLIELIKKINQNLDDKFQIEIKEIISNPEAQKELKDLLKKINLESKINQAMISFRVQKTKLQKSLDTRVNMGQKISLAAKALKRNLKLEQAKADVKIDNNTSFDLSNKLDSALRTALEKSLKPAKSYVDKPSAAADDDTQSLDLESVDTFIESKSTKQLKAFSAKSNQLLNTKAQLETVNIDELKELVQNRASEAKQHAKQEIKLQLHPQDLGQVKLEITRENNEITISLMVENDLALKSLKQEIAELNNSLKFKGLEIKEIEVSKSSDQMLSGDQQGSSNYNEAKEEQRNKYSDTLPNWVKADQSSEKTSFGSYFEGILEQDG